MEQIKNALHNYSTHMIAIGHSSQLATGVYTLVQCEVNPCVL